MSRPSQLTGNRIRFAPKSSNPIVAQFQKRKQAREQSKEDADRSITANKAENEEKIRNKLLSINFGASPLPQEVLDEKEYLEQPYGDIEKMAAAITSALDGVALRLPKEQLFCYNNSRDGSARIYACGVSRLRTR